MASAGCARLQGAAGPGGASTCMASTASTTLRVRSDTRSRRLAISNPKIPSLRTDPPRRYRVSGQILPEDTGSSDRSTPKIPHFGQTISEDTSLQP
eukprot:276496-Prymnesium_polylepis.1